MDTFEIGTLYGDPLQETEYAVHQQQTEDCAEMSAADVIGQITGQQVTEDDITAQAAHLQSSFLTDPITGQAAPLYDPTGGTLLPDLPTLLAAYGVQAEYTDNTVAQSGGEPTGLDALETQLAEGHHVIASVDAEPMWSSLGLPTGPDLGLADHAVVVTGVDTTNGIVYVNDSGVTGGAAERIPIDVFSQAWSAGNDGMVTTDDGVAAGIFSSNSTPADDPQSAPSPGFSVLPANLSTDPFGGPGVSDPGTGFDFGDSRFLAAGGAAVAAGLAAALLHPRTRAVTRTTRSRLRASRA